MSATRILSKLNGKYILFESNTAFRDMSTLERAEIVALASIETFKLTITSWRSLRICFGSNVTTVAIGTVTDDMLTIINAVKKKAIAIMYRSYFHQTGYIFH